MTALLTFALSLAGFAALALAKRRHYRDLLDKQPSGPLVFTIRFSGWALLAAGLAVAIEGEGVSIGMVFWLGAATAAALTVAMGLTYGPRARHRQSLAATRSCNYGASGCSPPG